MDTDLRDMSKSRDYCFCQGKPWLGILNTCMFPVSASTSKWRMKHFVVSNFYSEQNKIKFNVIKREKNLPYNLILLSTSPKEFFAMQRYDPISSFWNFLTVTIIRVSYSDTGVSCTWYFCEDTIISPVEWNWIYTIINYYTRTRMYYYSLSVGNANAKPRS